MPWLALLAGNAMHAVITALLGLSIITPADSLLILAIAAAASTVLGAWAARWNPAGRAPAVRTMAWLNLWTAVTFIAFFLGLAVYGAVVVFTLGASFAPLAVTAWSGLQAARNQGTRPGRAQWWAVCLLAGLGSALVTALAWSDDRGIVALLVAAALGVIDGTAAGGVAIVSRGLGRDGVGLWHVMAHRYYATTVVAAVALLVLVPSGVLAAPSMSLSLSIAAALGSLVVPFFLIQYAVQRLAPVLVTAAMALVPTIALFVEMAAGRAVSWPALVLGLLIVPVSLAVFATEHGQESADEAAAGDDGVEAFSLAVPQPR
jgi:drug/metabolite transporter (DMT)-like permease